MKTTKPHNLKLVTSWIVTILALFLNPLAFGHPEGENEKGPHTAATRLAWTPADDAGREAYQVQAWGPETPGDMHGGVLADSDGNVYVSRAGQPLIVLGQDGKQKAEWGPDSAGLHGMNFYSREGTTYLVGAGGNVTKGFTLSGEKLWEITTQGGVTAAAVTENGHIYVAHGYGDNSIHHFDHERKLVEKFGSKGEDVHQFKTPHGIAVAKVEGKERLIISDREKGRLVLLTLTGEYIKTLARDLPRPCCIAINPETKQIAVAGLVGSVTILDHHFHVVCRLGVNSGGPTANNKTDPAAIKLEHTVAIHGVCWDGRSVIGSSWNTKGRISRWEPIEG